ncbi:uncharacterized protein C8A04DRAFT_39239 [Dichotomopilus funicola]|uniref:Aminoglycoside phosphotransferase domain-containing protein n=1 Tax=Dichotomopilus funicola TaxID=1934379 RepID=A0AAN6UY12_9PEZI|nr:hypothetical protein C8A04DRAFT_39239 [Dichotomopilus funicola]
MPPNIAALSEYQIRSFFNQNDSVTREQCDAEAQRFTGQPVTATPSQGGTSYTVEGGDVVVQFRVPTSTLDMVFVRDIERTYQGFVPRHEYQGQLGQVHIYTMNNVGGSCIFLASAYHNTPPEMACPDGNQLLGTYLPQLQQLRQGLPERFFPTLDQLIHQLPDLFAEGWPLVPNHVDLLENNIHVDVATGKIVGICDWRNAEVSPFGMSLGGLETMLGVATTSGSFWRYHPNHEVLRGHFWTRFYHYLGGASDNVRRRIETARLIGLFLANGFEHDKPATEESEDLQFLSAVLLK